MTFFIHDVYHVRGAGGRMRVLWTSADRSQVAFLDVADPASWPVLVQMDHADELVASGKWKLNEDGVQPPVRLETDVKPAHLAKRDLDWPVIEGIVRKLPDLFDPVSRGGLIRGASDAHGRSMPNVRKILRRYLHGGMSKNAILPDFDNCGRGTRDVSAGTRKLGRPVPKGHPVGVVVDKRMRKLFALSVSLYYARNKKMNVADAYAKCMRLHFSDEVKHPESEKVNYVVKPEYLQSGLPTLAQFRSWLQKDGDLLAIGKRREPRRFEMRTRALIGTATAETKGPGSRFLIDATVLDVHVRSRGDENLLIGRPTLYVVVDVFSRMIVGMYVGLESPSYVAAMMALSNAAMPKVEFCKRFGIDIEESQWPCHHVPAVLEGDRGEMLAKAVEHLVSSFNVRIENASANRPDWKGIVEKRFDLLQTIFKPYIPGYVDTEYRERGATDYRDEATLDIDDLTAIIIEAILYFNNFHELKKYDRQRGMTQDKVLSIPIELWNWGIARSGQLRPPQRDRLHYALMPRAKASVTREGVYFEQRYYTSPLVLQKIAEAGTKRMPIEISYDKRSVDCIYLKDPSGEHGFQTAVLTERSAEFRGLSAWEAEGLRASNRKLSANDRTRRIMGRVAADAAAERRIERASKTLQPAEVGPLARKRGGRRQRADQLAVDRRNEVDAFRPGFHPAENAPSTNVVQLRSATLDRSRPSIADRLKGKRK